MSMETRNTASDLIIGPVGVMITFALERGGGGANRNHVAGAVRLVVMLDATGDVADVR